MTPRKSDYALFSAVFGFIAAVSSGSFPANAQNKQPAAASAPAPQAAVQPQPPCKVDLANPGNLKDILSNTLIRGFKFPRREVVLFLDGAQDKYKSGAELMKATATQFKLTEDVLKAKVEKYKHCNCKHPVPSALHPRLQVDPQPHPDCDIDLEQAGTMSDVLSNALMHARKLPQRDVRSFLDGASDKFEDGSEVFKETAAHFRLTEDDLADGALKFWHCNCRHAGGGAVKNADTPVMDDGAPISTFAKNVTLHVVLHEMGHALVREFDLPVLANEETMADAFATYYLTTYMPDRAVEVLKARATSWMIEAAESPGPDWSGEHDHDGRRAHQIAALAVAADPVKFKPVADVVKMSAEDIEDAVDYGAEIHRSWRRVLSPLWMPPGVESKEAKVACDDGSAFLIRLCESGLAREIETALKRFDWHSEVTVRFVDGDGKAGWSRSSRTITVNSAYVRRFIRQGNSRLALGEAPEASK